MFRTRISGFTAAVVVALALGFLTLSFSLAVPTASASGCETYGDGDTGDMPVDSGSQPQPSSCPSETPQPPTHTQHQPTPTHPPVTHNPPPHVAAPQPTHTPAPVPAPVPVSNPTTDYQPPAVVPHVPPHKVTKKAHPKPKHHTHRIVKKAHPKKAVKAACPSALPVVSTGYHFPWLLVALGALIALVGGGVAATRAYMATGHRWHPALRRVIAGPDHTRIDA